MDQNHLFCFKTSRHDHEWLDGQCIGCYMRETWPGAKLSCELPKRYNRKNQLSHKWLLDIKKEENKNGKTTIQRNAQIENGEGIPERSGDLAKRKRS